MKKIMTLSAVALAFTVTPALAGHHEGDKGHRGEKMFEKHDIDGDGVISQEEFQTHMDKKFSKMDADGDGNVTKEEAHESYEAMKTKWKEKRKKAIEGEVEAPAE
ncbi:MAG: EF-hand domain-containing protein [Micavibrio sp.]|nr:EF-hand domain-containing protein [Micavibrio sp.]